MIKTISVATLHEWLTSDSCLLLDVRETDEFAAGHIAQAHLHPLSGFPTNFSLDGIPATQKIVIQCRSGKRSATACQLLMGLSPAHQDIYNLEGGILAWQEADYPIER